MVQCWEDLLEREVSRLEQVQLGVRHISKRVRLAKEGFCSPNATPAQYAWWYAHDAFESTAERSF
jgi:hypothetical protein